jgi:hypothetical protein
MTSVTKVFVAGALGSFVASWAEPKILPHLPESLKSPSASTFTHAAVAGMAAAVTYWGLGKLGVAA